MYPLHQIIVINIYTCPETSTFQVDKAGHSKPIPFHLNLFSMYHPPFTDTRRQSFLNPLPF